MFIDKNSIMIVYPKKVGSPTSLGLYEKVGSVYVLTSDATFQNGKTYYVSMGQYILEAKYGYNKLWGKDSGRNLAGVQSGTLIGIFPKIILEFGPLTKSELELITPILDSASQTVVYYDPYKQAMTTMTTYTGDYEVSNKKLIYDDRTNGGFSISFIAVRKRT